MRLEQDLFLFGSPPISSGCDSNVPATGYVELSVGIVAPTLRFPARSQSASVVPSCGNCGPSTRCHVLVRRPIVNVFDGKVVEARFSRCVVAPALDATICANAARMGPADRDRYELTIRHYRLAIHRLATHGIQPPDPPSAQTLQRPIDTHPAYSTATSRHRHELAVWPTRNSVPAIQITPTLDAPVNPQPTRHRRTDRYR